MPSGWMIPPAGPRRPSPHGGHSGRSCRADSRAHRRRPRPGPSPLTHQLQRHRRGASATVRGPVRRPARSPRLTPTSLTAWTNQTFDRARMHVCGNRPSHVATRHSEDGTGGLMSHVSAPPQWGQSGKCEVLTPCIRHLNSSVHQMYLAPQMCQRDKH